MVQRTFLVSVEHWLKAVSLALQRFKDQCQNQTVGCYRQLNRSSLHKQTRRNTLGGDVCSPVEDHNLVPSLPDNIKSQTHSRMSECDGRPSVQVEPSPVNRMVTASAGVQTDLPQVVHSSCRSFCHSPEPQTSTIRVSSPRQKCLGHRCSEHKLVGSHCLCLPSHGSPTQGDPKNQAIQLPDHCYSPRLPRDALVLGPSAKSSEISTRTIYKSKWALFEKCCRENLVDFSTPSVKQVSDFFMYLYQDLNRRLSTIDGYRMAIVDTLGPRGPHISQSSDLNRLLSSFHRDRHKSSRNLPKWNLSVVLNELTKAPFEPMKDTDSNILLSKLLSC